LCPEVQEAIESLFYKDFLFDEQNDAASQRLTLLLGLLKALEDMNTSEMTLTNLLQNVGIDPAEVPGLRRRPTELPLRKVLPWLAQEHPAVFKAYQQHHGEKLEKALGNLAGMGYVASFISKALPEISKDSALFRFIRYPPVLMRFRIAVKIWDGVIAGNHPQIRSSLQYNPINPFVLLSPPDIRSSGMAGSP